MSRTKGDTGILFTEQDYLDYENELKNSERKRPNYLIAILPLLIVLVIAGVILLISVLLYPNLRDDQVTNEDSDSTLLYYFQISDLHIDLNYSSTSLPLGKYGLDSGTLLLNQTLEAMLKVNDNPEFILLTGDIVAHDRNSSEEQFLTIAVVTQIIQDYFPDTQVYPALGNNDVYPDYHFAVNTSSAWMRNLTSLWNMWLDTDQQQTFSEYGYYKVDELWSGGPDMLVLNSLLYSAYLVDTNNVNTTTPTPPQYLPDDPNGQFAWMVNEFKSAQQSSKKVILQYHIPPGVNSYDGSEQWHDKYTYQFYNICAEYSDVIMFHNSAHFHTDDFRLFGNTVVLLNPSVSPDHYNNPTFREYIVQGDIVVNYVQYYTDLVAANINVNNNQSSSFSQEYSLQSVYGADSVGYDSFQYIFNLISTSTPHYLQYYQHKYAFYAYQRDELLCAIRNANLTKYDDCTARLEDDE